MADWLLLRFASPDQPATWITADARGTVLSDPQSGPLALAAAQAPGKRLCVLVPGSDVLLTEPDVPAKAGSKLQQIVPYALEEQLAQDIEQLHFAIGKRPANTTRTPVAVVAHSVIQGWLQAFEAAGLKPEAMYADSDLLPRNPGQAVALLDGDTVVVRPPAGSAVTLPADALAEALELVQPPPDEQNESISVQPGRGLLLYAGQEEWQRYSAQVDALHERFEGIKVQLLPNGPLVLFAQQLATATPTNLLQGPYVPALPADAGWRAWRVAAILLVSLVGLHVVGKAAELALLKRTEKQLDASIQETFREAMPGETNTMDARRRMEQRLIAVRSATDTSGLLPALDAIAQARNAAPGAVLQALRFREGTVDMRVAAPDADALDRMSQTLRGRGWQADLTSGNVGENGYEGRIQVRPGGSS